ncbi:MAG: hypothetical protein PHY14_00785 [Candidatus Gracilibacteria bacterium]|nr:hypothetical protein [Candidatus Gracilibacteria bacterium]
MHHILSRLLIIALGFLPFMPIMHAEESHIAPDAHNMEESDCCHDCTEENTKNTKTHDMGICLKAVHDILGYSSANFSHAPEIVVAIFPYWTLENHREENAYETQYVHSQDPPWQFVENYIGIVKLTV